eukprot:GHVS01075388.1.p1 GENE.GHVS01075388.1~~GHVS01075388.1.p1  ORF type:complete len:487 (+),score=47.15 GHVS01075388.1:97-1557(+)
MYLLQTNRSGSLCLWNSCSRGYVICQRQQQRNNKTNRQFSSSTTPSPSTARSPTPTILSSSSLSSAAGKFPFCSTGFVREENSLLFYPTRDLLFKAHPPQSQMNGKIFIAKDYLRKQQPTVKHSEWSLKVVKKYTTVASHISLLSALLDSHSVGRPFPIYEIIVEQQPRVLYFDIDGPISEKQAHCNIVNDISDTISTAFKLSAKLSPTVLLSDATHKYSSHILFPQLQFCNHSEQSLCISLVFRLIAKLYPKLAAFVDTRPYSSFQAFRAPFAVKLKAPSGDETPTSAGRGILLIDRIFSDNPLTAFSTYVNPSYSVIPRGVRTADVILNNAAVICLRTNNELKRPAALSVGTSGVNLDIFSDEFIVKEETSKTVFYSCDDFVYAYETLLPLLHPSRSSHFDSWLYLSYTTYNLLVTHAIASPVLQRRVWTSWFAWSSGYKNFDQKENEDVVLRCKGRSRQSNGPLYTLLRMVQHDRPRTTLFPQ